MKKIITTLIVAVSAIGFGQNDLFNNNPFPQNRDLPVVINNTTVINNTQVNSLFDNGNLLRDNFTIQPILIDRVWSSETRFTPSDWQTPTYRYSGSTEEFLRDIEKVNIQHITELEKLRDDQKR